MKAKVLLAVPALLLALQANADCVTPEIRNHQGGQDTETALMVKQAAVGASLQALLECRQETLLQAPDDVTTLDSETLQEIELRWAPREFPVPDAVAQR